MKRACRAFAQPAGAVPDQLKNILPKPMPARLASVAGSFVALQEARHKADYDLSEAVARPDALLHAALSRQAMEDWHFIRTTAEAKALLTAMLLLGRR